MSHKPTHSYTVLPSYVQSLRVLSNLFAEMTQGLGKAIQFTKADSQRMLPALKNGAELLNRLVTKLHRFQHYQGQDWYEEWVRQATGSSALFGQATQQVQFYDILQQQLTHLSQTHRALANEIVGMEQSNGQQSAVLYLHALSEIVQLHTLQLTRIREQYEREIERWQNKIQQSMEKLARLATKLPENEAAFLPTKANEDDITSSLQQLVADLVQGWQRFRHQASPVQFDTTIATAQAGLVKIVREALYLGFAADPSIKSSALMHLRTNYTMQSERALHDQVLSGLQILSSSTNPPNDPTTEEIELF